MRNFALKSRLFNCLYLVSFNLLTGIAFIITIYSANTVISHGGDAYFTFYWLSPRFFALEGENLMLLYGGILSCVGGAMVPIKEVENALSLVKPIYRLFLLNILALISSLLLVLFLELITVPFRGNLDTSIILHSSKIFLGMLIFLVFWSLIGFGLRITFNSIVLSFAIGICTQLTELFIIFSYAPQIERYLPTALSRELVVSQFPFWDTSSWAYVKGAVVYANSSMLVDKYYQNVALLKYWIPTMLAYYGAIVFVIPIVRIYLGHHTINFDRN